MRRTHESERSHGAHLKGSSLKYVVFVGILARKIRVFINAEDTRQLPSYTKRQGVQNIVDYAQGNMFQGEENST